MTAIKLSPAFISQMQVDRLTDKVLVLLADDGGGKYSLHGGACSIGTKFTLIVLDQPDADYDVKLMNDAGLNLYTSQYDLMFFNDGIAMDYHAGRIAIKDNAHLLDSAVQITKGEEVLAAFQQGVIADSKTC